jgi:hypothetical protein
MSGISKKLMGTTAAGGGFTAIEDVFSTYLYTGNGSTQTITNGIDLAGEGGLVWFKDRTLAANNRVFDTERGYQFSLITNGTGAQSSHGSTGLTGFNSDGFGLGSAVANASGSNYASWTFRKAPRFFDVVTYTGDGTSSRAISHNLGVVPGCIIIKNTSLSANWVVHHRSLTAMSRYLELNTTNAEQLDGDNFKATSDTTFTVGPNSGVNRSGDSFVAYLFAHNDGDGGFGPDGDADIIKCGSFTSDGSGLATVDVGFEPQWVLYKGSTAATNWSIADSMRGFVADTASASGKYLNANSNSAELSSAPVGLTNTGFKYNSAPNIGFIYIAIRRGPMRAPESGTEVFGGLTHTGTGVGRSLTDLGFSPDLLLSRPRNIALGYGVYDRLRGFLGSNQILQTYNTGAEFSDATGPNASITKIEQGVISLGPDSFYGHTNLNTRPYITHAFRRAPGFFDVVAYTGDNVAGRTISHNLGVAPEMIWVKKRSEATDWNVYHSGLGPTKTIWLNQTSTGNTHPDYWYNTAPTSSVFSVGGGNPNNYTTRTYIAYLFATLAGVSKVGSYTGTGTHDEHVIDCGFTSGARFVLLKRTDAVSDWFVWDSERGITTGADPRLSLNIAAAEYNGLDDIHPHPSGFIAANPNGSDVNALNSQWIFYAIA